MDNDDEEEDDELEQDGFIGKSGPFLYSRVLV